MSGSSGKPLKIAIFAPNVHRKGVSLGHIQNDHQLSKTF